MKAIFRAGLLGLTLSVAAAGQGPGSSPVSGESPEVRKLAERGAHLSIEDDKITAEQRAVRRLDRYARLVSVADEALQYYRTHPADDSRWDALAVAYRARYDYITYRRMIDGKTREELARGDYLQADAFLASETSREIGRTIEPALRAADIHPVTLGRIAATRIASLYQGDWPAFIDHRVQGRSKEDLEGHLQEARRLLDRLAELWSSNEKNPAVPRYGWSLEGAWTSSLTRYRRMYKSLRSSGDYEAELERLAGFGPSAGAAYAKSHLVRTLSAGNPFNLKFTAFDGRVIDSAKLLGKVMLVDFWATWCGPCLEEMPEIKRLHRIYQPLGLEVVGVSVDSEKDRDKFIRLCAEQGLDWPQYFDGRGWKNEIALKYGVTGLPALFLVNREGILLSTDARGPGLEPAIRKALGLLPYEDATVVIPFGAEWRFLDSGREPSSDWTTIDNKRWPVGRAVLGYDDDTPERKFGTTLAFGVDGRAKFPVYYFTREFDVPAELAGRPFALRLTCDDGAVIYVNGKEVARPNMPSDEISGRTLAIRSRGIRDLEITGPAGLLKAGPNVIAASVHQASPASSDLAFDLQLLVFPKGR